MKDMKLKAFITSSIGPVELAIVLTAFMIAQIWLDYLIIKELEVVRNLPALPAQNAMARDFIREQLEPFEIAPRSGQ